MVAMLAESGPYDGRSLDDINCSRSRRGLLAVEKVWSSKPKCTDEEVAGFMGVVTRRHATRGAVTCTSLLQEGTATHSKFYGMVVLCSENDVAVPATFVEALPLIVGGFSEGKESLAAVRQAEEATFAEAAKTSDPSRTFVEYNESTNYRISQMESDL